MLGQDLVVVPADVYRHLKEWYGGGGPDFARRVVGVGNNKEPRVELHPYFLRYSVVKHARHRGTQEVLRSGVVVLDSTTALGDAAGEVVRDSEERAADCTLFIVQQEEEEEGRGQGGAVAEPEENGVIPPAPLPPMSELSTTDDKPLVDVFHGRHSIEVSSMNCPSLPSLPCRGRRGRVPPHLRPCGCLAS
jgi:hypothetical protein